MKLFINILKYLLITCITMCLIIGTYILVFSGTILNKEYTLKQLEISNYYESIYNEIEENFKKYISQSGLDEEILNDILTEDIVKEDTIQIVNCIYDGKEITLNTSNLRERLQGNIEDSLQNQKLSSSTKKAIDEFIEKIINEYKETMSHSKYLKEINKVLIKVEPLVEKLKISFVIGILVFLIILLILNIGNVYKFIANVGISLVSTGAFIVIGNIILKMRVKIEYIKILNDSISKVIVDIIENIIWNLNKISIVSILVGIIIIVIGSILQEKKKVK